MNIDWSKTLEDIFDRDMTCPRCGLGGSEMMACYSRETWAAEFAPRCHDCTDKEDCETRKLVFLCRSCTKELDLRARPVDRKGMMLALLDDCRNDLDDCLVYLAEDWQEDLDVDPDEVELGLEKVAPAVFEAELEDRARFENEYLGYHRWFRRHHFPIPQPEWRGRYVEGIIALGYETALGD
jgi:hypothetical protein